MCPISKAGLMIEFDFQYAPYRGLHMPQIGQEMNNCSDIIMHYIYAIQ